MEEYQKIELAVSLDACDFTSEVEDECVDNEISTHYQNDTFSIEWSNEEELPVMKAWLVETYGPDIKNYSTFAVLAT